MRTTLIAATVVLAGTLFVVGCNQTSSSTTAPLAPSTNTSAAMSSTAQLSNPMSSALLRAAWSSGWDVTSGEPLNLDQSEVDWHQPGKSSNLQISYHLVGARPRWVYQVGVHLFDRCDPAFGQFPQVIPCSRPATRQGFSRNVQAFDLGTVTTDSFGNVAQGFTVQNIARGTYELEFDIRAGEGCPPSNCDVIFQSPGPFGRGTVTVSIQ
jgi:hypothetical protein